MLMKTCLDRVVDSRRTKTLEEKKKNEKKKKKNYWKSASSLSFHLVQLAYVVMQLSWRRTYERNLPVSKLGASSTSLAIT